MPWEWVLSCVYSRCHRLAGLWDVHPWKWSEVKVAQSCPTLCDPIDYIVHGILQARILEWVAFSFSRVSSQPRDGTQVSCIAGGFFTSWATREAPKISQSEHWIRGVSITLQEASFPVVFLLQLVSKMRNCCTWIIGKTKLLIQNWSEIKHMLKFLC